MSDIALPKLSIAEPVSKLRSVKIVENGDPLVNFLEHCPTLILDTPRFHYRRETLIRLPVADMLCQADKSLPKGYRLAIVEGWRAPHIQKRMYLAVWGRFKERHPEWSDVTLRRVVNRYTAPLSAKVPPPHSTGGAVDLMLITDDGTLCDHCSPYDRYDPACYSFDAPGLSGTARHHRDILAEVLLPTGLTNYPSEYWHWSYGDQGWAYRGRHPHALYNAITPDNYEPEPEDVSELPLVWIDPNLNPKAHS